MKGPLEPDQGTYDKGSQHPDQNDNLFLSHGFPRSVTPAAGGVTGRLLLNPDEIVMGGV